MRPYLALVSFMVIADASAGEPCVDFDQTGKPCADSPGVNVAASSLRSDTGRRSQFTNTTKPSTNRSGTNSVSSVKAHSGGGFLKDFLGGDWKTPGIAGGAFGIAIAVAAGVAFGPGAGIIAGLGAGLILAAFFKLLG